MLSRTNDTDIMEMDIVRSNKQTSDNIPHVMPTLTKKEKALQALLNPLAIRREINNRSFYEFVKYFWDDVSNDEFKDNWHIRYLCEVLQEAVERVAANKPKKNDIIINIPPGMTKTIICSIMLEAWCWSKWFWMRFITGGYSHDLSLESAEYCRDLVMCDKWKQLYPELTLKSDKQNKSNYKMVKLKYNFPGRRPVEVPGGNRFSTSVGGTVTGIHAHVIVIDDPLNPKKALSEVELQNANHWMDHTLSTRKTDKKVTLTILIMQRLHQDDPSGHILDKKNKKVFHICLPGEIKNYAKYVSPPELIERYNEDGLLDSTRLSWSELKELETDLGPYGFAGQIGQNPVPPGGGMFKVDHFQIIDRLPHDVHIVGTIRYWDKAGTEGGGKRTAGVKMLRLINNRYIIVDVKKGHWGTDERESIIRETAEADGRDDVIWIEQEPGSSGKESAESTIRNLSGFVVYADTPSGDKNTRAIPFSVQVNIGNVYLLRSDWNKEYIDELRFFPFGKYKDQVDASSGAFNKLSEAREASMF